MFTAHLPYVPGTVDKKVTAAATDAPEKPTVQRGRRAVNHTISKQHGKFLNKYREARAKGHKQ